jgi:hypothetical protein
LQWSIAPSKRNVKPWMACVATTSYVTNLTPLLAFKTRDTRVSQFVQRTAAFASVCQRVVTLRTRGSFPPRGPVSRPPRDSAARLPGAPVSRRKPRLQPASPSFRPASPSHASPRRHQPGHRTQISRLRYTQMPASSRYSAYRNREMWASTRIKLANRARPPPTAGPPARSASRGAASASGLPTESA